jgi:hypothetical protein
MKTKFNAFNMVLIILIILGAVGAVGVGYYGLKKTPSVSTTAPTSEPSETPPVINQSHPAHQEVSNSVEIVWPDNQELNGGVGPLPNSVTPNSVATTPSSSTSLPIKPAPGAVGNQISNTYLNAYQKAQNNKELYKEISFKATIYQSLPLRDFIEGLNIKIYPTIYQNLDQTNYRAVFCYRGPDLVDKGFIFKFSRPTQISDYRRIYDEVDSGLSNWEGNIFSDLKNVLFPGSNFKTTPKFQTTVYTSEAGTNRSTIRYANIKDQNDNNLFIGYAYHSERIFLANSQDCLEKILDTHEIAPWTMPK